MVIALLMLNCIMCDDGVAGRRNFDFDEILGKVLGQAI